MRPYGAMLVPVAGFVAVPEGHALGREEAPQERAHGEYLVADQLEEPANLPLRHRAQAEPGHVYQRPQVGRHDQVGSGGVREDESRVFAGDAGFHEIGIEFERPFDLVRVPSQKIRIRIGYRAGQHRRSALLVRDVALALLVERHAGSMAHELVAEGATHAGDGEGEDDVLDR